MYRSLIPVMALTLLACGPKPCKHKELIGKEAELAILKAEKIIPGSFVIIPASHMESTTREIEMQLNALAEKQLLTWQLRDSTPRERSLARLPQDTIFNTFYQYDLQWSPSVELVKDTLTENIFTSAFMDQTYPEHEIRFTSLKALAGTIKFSRNDQLRYEEDCDHIKFTYTIIIDSTNALARIAGLPEKILQTRSRTIPVEKK